MMAQTGKARWTGWLSKMACGVAFGGLVIGNVAWGQAVGPVSANGREMPKDAIHGQVATPVPTHSAEGAVGSSVPATQPTGQLTDERVSQPTGNRIIRDTLVLPDAAGTQPASGSANAGDAADGAATAKVDSVDRAAFAKAVDVTPLERVIIQNKQTLKTLDTFSRQSLYSITGRSTLDGQRPVYTLLDILYRPDAYRQRALIKVKNAPLRRDIAGAKFLDEATKKQIRETGLLSYAQIIDPQMQVFLTDQAAQAAFKQSAVQDVEIGWGTLNELLQPNLRALRVIADGVGGDQHWHTIEEMSGNMPADVVTWLKSVHGEDKFTRLAGYEGKEQLLNDLFLVMIVKMQVAWDQGNSAEVNALIVQLADLLPQVNPAIYPSHVKRSAEVYYNKLSMLTVPGAAVYFIAFVCFLVASQSKLVGPRFWAIRIFMIALLIHTAAIGIRWWLAVTSVGNWFEAIPIKNQFESVMFSAWFGAVVGLILELRRSRGLIGAAASFVGWMSLTALFAMPYVAGRDIGGNMGQVAGVLMSYWLYIHVTMVTAAYALIGMSFLLGTWWLIKYYAEYGTLARVPAAQLSADAAERAETTARAMRMIEKAAAKSRGTSSPGLSGAALVGAGAPAVTARAGFWATLIQVLFFIRAKGDEPANAASKSASSSEEAIEPSRAFLAVLDQCNLVVLQLAFWVLGVGIVLGAVWADQSWGRPWGWDPKETFALVTWIVYLVVVHVRVATEDKAWWTAVLSIIGFAVMLFNWIGVNFWLVGLHSYA